MMIGRRVFPNRHGYLVLPEGGYGKDLKGRWWARPPGEDAYQLTQENVVEHPDGTVTVTAGINGYGMLLHHGVWRQPNEVTQ